MTQNRPPPYMSTFTELKIGRVPITEEGVDRYQINDSILSHFSELSSLEDLNVSVGRIWTEMKVPLPWLQICTANYITGTITFNNPAASSLEVRGWIDSVEPVSDTEDFPVCRVKWHFDYWEMYKNTAFFNYGQVKRRPYKGLESTPIQDYPVRYYELSGDHETASIRLDDHLIQSVQGYEIWYIVFSYNRPDPDDSTKTEVIYGQIPVSLAPNYSSPLVIYGTNEDGRTGQFYTPSMQDIYNGYFDEAFSIPPEDLNGVWLSPFAFTPEVTYNSSQGYIASDYVSSGGAHTPVQIVQGNVFNPNLQNSYYGFWRIRFLEYASYEKDVNVTSSEEERFVLVNVDGTRAHELPYGMHISKAVTVPVLEPDEAYLQISFRDSTLGSLEGCSTIVPLLNLPVNENAWSTYAYTGKRDYEIGMRKLQTDADAWKSSVSGAGTGAMMGAFGPQGLALGVAGGLLGGMTSYAVESLWQNDEIQKNEDRLMANQLSTMLLSSNAMISMVRINGISIRKLIPDAYSRQQIQNTRSNYGISVDEILGSCDSLIRQESPTGFYQIPNLIISGPLPVEAKDTIKQKFSAGVRLI